MDESLDSTYPSSSSDDVTIDQSLDTTDDPDWRPDETDNVDITSREEDQTREYR